MKRKRSSNSTGRLVSSSGGSSSSGTGYDVFLSFRGPDTRYGFTDCLYEFTTAAGIRVFLDDEGIRKGEEIGEDLLWAINNSRFFIPIFSKDYASSKWCLRELAAMVESTRNSPEKEILPIFYHVNPSNVKLRSRLYADVLLKHEKDMEPGIVQEWRQALRHVSKIKGWHLKDGQGEGKLIKQIAKEISTKLRLKHRIMPDILIGLDHKVEDVMNLLDCGSTDVRFVIIYGMGGIGKTTLAKAIFNKICDQFQISSFLSNVRESSQDNRMIDLQKQLLYDALHLSSLVEFDMNKAMHSIRSGFFNKNSLIVLDDVSSRDHITNLVGLGEWLGHGSRVIVTTRDLSCIPHKEEIINRASEHSTMICTYEVTELGFNHALQLFSQRVFGKNSPPCSHEKLSGEVLSIVGGIPLAIEVTGSYLCGQRAAIWQQRLKKLRKAPPKDIRSILMISYEELEKEEREIFLDIACFFAGQRKGNAFYYWEACDFIPEITIETLFAMSLVKFEPSDELWMHDLLRDLGRDVVHRESIENPGRRSRLWLPEDVSSVLESEEISRNVKALKLTDQSHAHNFTCEELKRLPNLTFLELCGGNFEGNFKNLLSKLRWLSWYDCPSKIRVRNFYPKNLVVLKLCNGNITSNWNEWRHIKMLGNLKVLELIGLMITKTPDLSSCSSLERLVIDSCENLCEIDQSIGKLKSLNYLSFRHSSIKELPEELGSLSALRELIIDNRPWKRGKVPLRLPRSMGKLMALTKLSISGVGINELPVEIGELRSLKMLYLFNCSSLDKLPDSIGDLCSLEELSLYHLNITELPESIGDLCSLEKLSLYYLNITELPESIGRLNKLNWLNVSSNRLRRLPAAIGRLPNLEYLLASGNCDLEGEFPGEYGELQSLVTLVLSCTRVQEFTPAISRLSSLGHLLLRECNPHLVSHLDKLPTSLGSLWVETSSVIHEVPDLSHLTNLWRLIICDGSDGRYVPEGHGRLLGSRNLSWVQNHQQIYEGAPILSRDGPAGELSFSQNLSWVLNLPILVELEVHLSRMVPLSTELGSHHRLWRLSLNCPDPSCLQLPPCLKVLRLMGCKQPVHWEWRCHYGGGSLLGFENFLSLLTYTQLKGLELAGKLGGRNRQYGMSTVREYDLFPWVDSIPDGSCPKESVASIGHRSLQLQRVPDLSQLRKLMDSGIIEVKPLENLDMEKPWNLQLRFWGGMSRFIGFLAMLPISSMNSFDEKEKSV